MSEVRKIIHVDMDCFYAAVEMRDDPRLREVPLAVGGSSRRGVVTTANYEARRFGVHSALPVFLALQRCPHLVLVPPRFERYRALSREIRALLRSWTPLVEPLSLDEAYLDVTDAGRPATTIATEIRQRIRHEFRLPVSAGVAPNKLLAKIASDWNKPNGQFVLPPGEVPAFVRDLPVRRLWGIGPRAEERLHAYGVHSCAQLQQWSAHELEQEFGRFGAELFLLCRGIDHRPVQPARIRKSLSNERTFSEPVASPEDLEARVADLHEELLADLHGQPELRQRVAGVFVKVKFSDFSSTSLSRSGPHGSLSRFLPLAHEAFARSPLPARLLGLGFRFHPSPSPHHQLLLPLP